jgi:hypothetical protein
MKTCKPLVRPGVAAAGSPFSLWALESERQAARALEARAQALAVEPFALVT